MIGIHGGLAILSGRSEWALDSDSKIFDGKTESEFLAQSIKDVAVHYGAGAFDQKTLDWFNLIQCLMIVYGGRIYAIRSTPKVRPQPKPTVHETAQTQGRPQTFQQPAPRSNGAQGDAGRVHVAGIGDIDLPDNHPLNPNYKPN